MARKADDHLEKLEFRISKVMGTCVLTEMVA